MRDVRFKAVHCGGLLDLHRHRLLATWAAGCAEHVLPLFSEKHLHDERPRRAIEAGRAWACGNLTVGEARAAALKAHAAARDSADDAAQAAARAAGHAVATAHMADHALRSAAYAVRAMQAAGNRQNDAMSAARERVWQQEQLPEEIRALVVSSEERQSKSGEEGEL